MGHKGVLLFKLNFIQRSVSVQISRYARNDKTVAFWYHEFYYFSCLSLLQIQSTRASVPKVWA